MVGRPVTWSIIDGLPCVILHCMSAAVRPRELHAFARLKDVPCQCAAQLAITAGGFVTTPLSNSPWQRSMDLCFACWLRHKLNTPCLFCRAFQDGTL